MHSTTDRKYAYESAPMAEDDRTTYMAYPKRWYILTVTSLLAFSNATIWISYTAIQLNVSVFYCDEGYFTHGSENATSLDFDPRLADCMVPYWVNQLFQIVGVIGGLMSLYITDTYGIVVATHCASTTNAFGAFFRAVSSVPALDHAWRLRMLYGGQSIAALSQTFFLVLCPKVAEYWFPDHQRSLANSLMFSANPFGVVIGTILPHFIIPSRTTRDDSSLLLLNIAVFVPAAAGMVMAMGVTRSRPPTPPSASSANADTPSVFTGMMRLFTIPDFYVQMFTFGMAFGLQYSLFISIEPMMTQLGYDWTGVATALNALAGFVSCIFIGIIIDKTKKFAPVFKVLTVLMAVFSIAINAFIRHKSSGLSDTVVLGFLLTVFGFFATPTYPVGLELGIETTYPILEATSSGVLIIASQIMLFACTSVLFAVFKLDSIYETKRTPGYEDKKGYFDSNYQLGVDVWTLMCIVYAVVTCLILWPKYERLEYEKSVHDKTIAGNATDSQRSSKDSSTETPLPNQSKTALVSSFST